MIAKFKLFLQESKQELNRVNWPSRQETVKLTIIVVVISLGISFFLGMLDALFTFLLKLYIHA